MSHKFKYATLLELELDRCANRYGAAPCTAGVEIHSGTSVGAGVDTITLAAGASAVDDLYKGKAIALADGRYAVITKYDGTSKVAPIDRLWPVNRLARSDQFELAPWTVLNGATLEGNAIAGPRGTLATRIIGTDPTRSFSAQVRQQFNLPVSAARRVQLFIKAGTSLRTRVGIFELVAQQFRGDFELAWSSAGVPSILTQFSISNLVIRRDVRGWWFVAFTSTFGGANDNVFFIMPDRDGEGRDVYAWRAQIADSDQGFEPIKTEASSVVLPTSSSYRILEVGGQCYNTFGTCQDRDNFAKESLTYQFCDRGARPSVGDEIRPYIAAKDFAATEIDLEQGLARRGQVTLDLQDEPAADGIADLYASTRPAPAAGEWLARLLARNTTAVGRPGRIGQMYAENDWDWEQFRFEYYIIDTISGPDARGRVRVTLKDPIKLTDRRKLPEPTDGKLEAAIDASALSLELGSGEGAEYADSGYVNVGREVIRYTAKAGDVLSWPGVPTYRGTFGTEAASHGKGAGVQQCEVWLDTPITAVLRDILTRSGLEIGLIDQAGFDQEEIDWYGPAFNVTACIAKPEKSSALLADLLRLSASFMWWSPHEQLVKFQAFAPARPGEQAALFTDAANFLEGSTNVTKLDDLRSTLRALYYALISPTVDRKVQSNYDRSRIRVDQDAESANEYDDRRVVTQFSRWWPDNDQAAFTLISRASIYYRDAPAKFEATVAAKDIDTTEGDLVDVETAQLVDDQGQPKRSRYLVTRHKDLDGAVALTLRSTGFGKRYAFIGPAGAGDYPADEAYAHIAADAEGFSDGTSAYLIF